MPAPRRHVDRAATLRRDEGEAIGGEDLRPEVKRAQHSGLRVNHFGATGAKIAERRVCPGRLDGGLLRENLHHAAERGVAPRGRAATLDNLDAREIFAGHLGPCDPAAEGIVERHAVEEDEGAARATGAEAAQ